MQKISKTNNFLFSLSLIFPLLIYSRNIYDQSINTAILSVISFLILIYSFLNLKNGIKISYKQIYPFILLFITGTFSSIFRGFDVIDTLNKALPTLFFCFGFLLIQSYLKKENNIKFVLNIIFILIILSTIYKYYLSISYYKLSLEEMRYQIIPHTYNLILGFMFASFTLGFKKIFGFICLLFFFIITFYSATRGLLLIFFVSFLFSLLIKNNYKLLKTIIIYSFIILLLFIILKIFNENFYITKFFNRLSIYKTLGYDPTVNTRLQEIYYIFNSTFKNSINLIFGHGYMYPISVLDYNLNSSGEISRYQTIGFGHNFYAGLIFVGGIFIGLYCIITFFKNLIVFKTKKIIKFLKDDKIQKEHKFLFLFGYLSFICFLVNNLYGTTFGGKAASLYFGLTFGIMCFYIDMVVNKENENRYKTKKT